jgi:hypothetical protein
LMQLKVRMAAALRAARHVIEVVHASNVERCLLAALDEGEVAARVLDAWQLGDDAVGDGHGGSLRSGSGILRRARLLLCYLTLCSRWWTAQIRG